MIDAPVPVTTPARAKYIIVTHKCAHNDEQVAIMLLLMYGDKIYPGIADAVIEYVSDPDSVDGERAFKDFRICVGVGGWIYDDHKKREQGELTSSARLVAEHLGLMQIPEVARIVNLVSYADSTDDVWVYELSTLVKQWHRYSPNQERAVFARCRHILTDLFRYERDGVSHPERRTFTMADLAKWYRTKYEPHFNADIEGFNRIYEALVDADTRDMTRLEIFRVFQIWQELYPPEMHPVVKIWCQRILDDIAKRDLHFHNTFSEYRTRVDAKKARMRSLVLSRANDRKIWVAIEQTSDPEFQVAARALGVGMVLVQGSKGNIQVITNKRRHKHLNLDVVIAQLRKAELRKRGLRVPKGDIDWTKGGKIDECKWWYYHRDGKMLLNGSDQSSSGVEPTALTPKEILNIIEAHADYPTPAKRVRRTRRERIAPPVPVTDEKIVH